MEAGEADEKAVPIPGPRHVAAVPPMLPSRVDARNGGADAAATPASSSFGTSLFGGWMDDAGLPTASPLTRTASASRAPNRGSGDAKAAGPHTSSFVDHVHFDTAEDGSGRGSVSGHHRPAVRIQEYGIAEEGQWAEGGGRHGGSDPSRTPRRPGYVALAMTSNALADKRVSRGPRASVVGTGEGLRQSPVSPSWSLSPRGSFSATAAARPGAPATPLASRSKSPPRPPPRPHGVSPLAASAATRSPSGSPAAGSRRASTASGAADARSLSPRRSIAPIGAGAQDPPPTPSATPTLSLTLSKAQNRRLSSLDTQIHKRLASNRNARVATVPAPDAPQLPQPPKAGPVPEGVRKPVSAAGQEQVVGVLRSQDELVLLAKARHLDALTRQLLEPPAFIDLARVAVPTPTPTGSVRAASPASSVGAPSTLPRDGGDGYDADNQSDGNESPRGVLTAVRALTVAAGAAPVSSASGPGPRRGAPAGSAGSVPPVATTLTREPASDTVSDNSDDQDASRVPQPLTTALIAGALSSIPEVRVRAHGAGAIASPGAGAGTGSVSPRRRRTRSGFQPTTPGEEDDSPSRPVSQVDIVVGPVAAFDTVKPLKDLAAEVLALKTSLRKHESASVLVDQLYEAFSEATERQFVKDKQYEMLAAREQALQEQVTGLARAMAAFAALTEGHEHSGPGQQTALVPAAATASSSPPALSAPTTSNSAGAAEGSALPSISMVKDVAAEAAAAAATAAAAAATTQLQAQLAFLQSHLAALEASQRVAEARQLTAEREAAAAARAATEATVAAKAAADAAAEERRQARAALSLTALQSPVSITPEVPMPEPTSAEVAAPVAAAVPAAEAVAEGVAEEAVVPGVRTPANAHARSRPSSRHASASPPGVTRTVADRRVSTVDGVVVGQEWTGVEDEPQEPGGRPLAGSSVVRQYEKRRVKDSVLQSIVFEGVSMFDADWLMERAEVVFFDAGEAVLVQGALGSCFHFITDGEVAVKVTEPDGGVRELFHRFKGQVVGEFGMMQGKRRTASVVCVTKCSTLKVTRSLVQSVMAGIGPSTLAASFRRLFKERLQSVTGGVQPAAAPESNRWFFFK